MWYSWTYLEQRNLLRLFEGYNGQLVGKCLPSFSISYLSSLSLHLLKSLSQRGAHQISIVDLLMLRSVLHRQRFHTQDEREMNTEDAGGWHGALTTPAIAHSHRFTAPSWSDLRGSEEEEVLRLRFWHLYNDGKGSRWPKTDVLIGFSVISKPSCNIDLWRGTGERAALLVSAGLEEPSSHETETPPLCLQATEPWQIFLFHSMSPGHLKRLLMLAVRLPALPRLALPCLPRLQAARYCCISLRPLLNEHWDKARGEWTVWLHRREAWAPQSNVPLKYLSAL